MDKVLIIYMVLAVISLAVVMAEEQEPPR